MTKEFFIGFGTYFWNYSIFILPENYLMVEIEFINFFFKIFPLILTSLGCFCAYNLYLNNMSLFYKIKQSKFYYLFYTFFLKKWYFDRLYNQIISQNFLFTGYFLTYQQLDRGLLEFIGPFGITNILNSSINNLKYIQSGQISQYLFLFFFFIFTTISIMIISF